MHEATAPGLVANTGQAELTILNSMASEDFDTALATHQAWNLRWLDLRDAIYGKRIAALEPDDSKRARDAIDAHGLQTFCMSTSIFFEEVEKGRELFVTKHLGQLDRVIAIAKVLEPRVVRLIAAQLPSRKPGQNAIDMLSREYPWVFDLYREAIDRLVDAGLRPTIENEAFKCFLSSPAEFVQFFDILDRHGKVGLTWDVQNQWATGCFPTLEDYHRLKPLIQYYHVKGGQAEPGETALRWNVALADASWPVADITRHVIADGVSPVICINPAQHGEAKPGYEYANLVRRDIDYLRLLPDVAG